MRERVTDKGDDEGERGTSKSDNKVGEAGWLWVAIG